MRDIGKASPPMAHYGSKYLEKKLWKRQELSLRDRSIVTLSSLIARNDQTEIVHYLNIALDNGVEPDEISEILAHLSFYAGWPNASAAAFICSMVFQERNVQPEQLSGGKVKSLPLDINGENHRRTAVKSNFGEVSPGVVKYTTEALFTDLWLRPGLAPRDRSLVTICALITNGQVAQVTYHLGRAMDNGLTKEQMQEVLTQLAFYAGWPCIFLAMPFVKDVFESRGI
ncbi:4-carboxymuconolactone decarboxylase [Erwinia billingiae]|nr:4-carboxymuconolactone decarboxylase [Erwinia billingiae]